MQGRRKDAVEHYRQKLISKNIPLVPLEDYSGCSTKILHRCTVCGCEFYTSPKNVSAGHYCPECGKKKCVETRRITTQDFIQKLSDDIRNRVDIIGEYHGARQKISARCNVCNYEWEPLADNLLHGHACPKCTKRLNRDPEEFKKIVESFGKVKVLGTYVSNSHYITVQCVKCGKVWDVYPNSVLIGGGCRECSYEDIGAKNTLTHDEFLKRSSLHPTVKIVGKYQASDKPLECECKVCGYQWAPSATNIGAGHGCPKCSGRIKTHDDFIQQVNELSPTIKVLTRYISSKDRVDCECQVCGHHWQPVASSLCHGYGCPKCRDRFVAELQTKSNEQFLSELQQIQPTITPLEEYQKSDVKILFRCNECNMEWRTTPASVLSGSGCPHCNLSRGERAISVWLNSHNIQYVPQYKFNDLIGVGGGLLSYDFYLPKFNVLLEYQGIQHFEPVEMFGGQKQYELQVEHDRRKKVYALDNGYYFIDIRYDEDIQSKLSKVFLESVTTATRSIAI